VASQASATFPSGFPKIYVCQNGFNGSMTRSN
jgi:hypothetical protein